jgi:hypothetical protein
MQRKLSTSPTDKMFNVRHFLKKKNTASVFLDAGVIHGAYMPLDTKIKANIGRDLDICHEVLSYTTQHVSGTGVLAVVSLGTSETSNL